MCDPVNGARCAVCALRCVCTYPCLHSTGRICSFQCADISEHFVNSLFLRSYLYILSDLSAIVSMPHIRIGAGTAACAGRVAGTCYSPRPFASRVFHDAYGLLPRVSSASAGPHKPCFALRMCADARACDFVNGARCAVCAPRCVGTFPCKDALRRKAPSSAQAFLSNSSIYSS